MLAITDEKSFCLLCERGEAILVVEIDNFKIASSREPLLAMTTQDPFSVYQYSFDIVDMVLNRAYIRAVYCNWRGTFLANLYNSGNPVL
jgi:hypothetical protein